MRIFILEDEPLIAESLYLTLQSLGYNAIEPCFTFKEAMELLQNESPDLALLDINIAGKNRGLEIGQYIKDTFNIPIIFLTAYSDREIVEAAKTLNPANYLIKPYTQQEIFIAIEIAMNNHSANNSSYYLPHQKNTLNVKLGEKNYKISSDQIVALESEGKHTIIHTIDKRRYPLRMAMHKVAEIESCKHLVQVHKSWYINPQQIASNTSKEIQLHSGINIPLGRIYKEMWNNFV